MKNKGFTLIELLGVIILLTLLIIIVYPNIIDSVKNSSEKTDELTLRMIYDAADLYVSNNKKQFTGTYNGKYIIDLQDLVDADILSSPIKLSDSDDITNDKCVQVTYSYEDGYKYELRDNGECEGPSYSITYNLKNVEIDNSLETIQEKERYIATLTLKTGYKDYILDVKVIMGNEDITQTVYDNGEINIENVTGNIEITAVAAESYFAADTWDEIAENVKNGNTNNYHVGDEKEVTLDDLGTHTVRIANMSTPSECNQVGFSQTACGFVIEFVGIISMKQMNSTQTSSGGWSKSILHDYVTGETDSIYNALPDDLKSNIIDTYVVSGSNSNYNSAVYDEIENEKLYLLSSYEIYGKKFDNTTGSYWAGQDSLNGSRTRQLDYYNCSSQNNCNQAIKKSNTGAVAWWLRSSLMSTALASFNGINELGTFYGYKANSNLGVSPAFRIG
ncbi:MAG: prepilin-type N-terminal cleavage/methylation domain-containing protein [Firmicutes bacterium]|nr:prepilin-type N-terminal cleavage/methylation domain-containing protein [Bacillota bacterium]